MAAVRLPTDAELRDPTFIAWLARLFAGGRSAGNANIPLPPGVSGRSPAYYYARLGYEGGLSIDQYASNWLRQLRQR